MESTSDLVVTVTPNPAIDQTVFAPGFRAGGVNRATGTESHAGGKGVNVAACLADCGVPTAATGFLGADNDGIFVAHFHAQGIEDRFVRVPGATRIGIKIVDEVRAETTDVNFPGLSPREADVERLLCTIDELAAGDRWFVLSGSLPGGLPADFYADVIRRIRRRGGRVALDTSGAALRSGIEAKPDLVKPNLHELADLCRAEFSGVADVLRAAFRLASDGIRTVVISMGRQGAVFVEGSEAVLALPPTVTVRSTVAAGDAMVAGLLVGERDGRDLAGRARLATAFALGVLTRVGAGADARAVAAFEREVRIERCEGFARV